jgi:hypothetical protein
LFKVHDPNYKTGYQPLGVMTSGHHGTNPALVSPSKSDLSEYSIDDAVEMAQVKQQIIASKVAIDVLLRIIIIKLNSSKKKFSVMLDS